MIPPDAGKRKGARPGWNGGIYAFMRRVLATDRGGELYRRRNGMIEPVFAHTKFNRRIDRFQRRGRAAARSEWRLITATHNLLKLHTHTLAAAGASEPRQRARGLGDQRAPSIATTDHTDPLRESHHGKHQRSSRERMLALNSALLDLITRLGGSGGAGAGRGRLAAGRFGSGRSST